MAAIDLSVYTDAELAALMLDVSSESQRRNALRTAESRISAAVKDATASGVVDSELDDVFSRAREAGKRRTMPPPTPAGAGKPSASPANRPAVSKETR